MGVDDYDGYGERISPNSICVLTKASPKDSGNSASRIKVACERAICTKTYLYLILEDNNNVICPRGGGAIKPADSIGPVYCPDYNLICTAEVYCNSITDCINKKSRPKIDTFNYDYTIATSLTRSNLGSIIQPPIDMTGEGPCIPSCSGCYSKTMCNLCPSNYKLLVEPFYYCDNLPSNQYYKDYGEFFRCDALINGCLTCTKSRCKSCRSQYYYEDEDCNFNKNSNPYCSKKDSNGCIACFSGYIMIESNPKCVHQSNYNLAEYYSNDGIKYFPCSKAMSNCKECTSSSKCTKCNSGFYLIDNNSCTTLNLITNGEYITLDDGKTYNSCSNVIPHCKKCDNNKYCKECFEEYVFLNDIKNPRCVDDIEIEDIAGVQYDSLNDIFFICENGFKSIKFCDNLNSIICENENTIKIYQYNSESNCYNKCNVKNCKDCSDNINQCKICLQNYTIVDNNNNNCILINTLGNNYYTNDNEIHYYSCYYKFNNCYTCTKNGEKCTKCNTNYYFLNNDYSKCYKESDLINQYKNGMYKFNSIEYYSCNKGVNKCLTCLNGTYCYSCENNYNLICNYYDKCYLSKELSNTYFKDNNLNCYKLCKDYGCYECLSETNCQSCINKYELFNNRCYEEGSVKNFCVNSLGYIKNCNEVMTNCLYCLSCSICKTCSGDNVVIYKNENSYPCIKLSELKNKYYLNITNNVYYPCHMSFNHCKSCTNEKICLECLNNYALVIEENYSSSCILETEIDKKKYILSPNNEIKKYYPCSFYINDCSLCTNINTCEKCKKGYGFINWDISKCENISSKDICSPDNINYFSCLDGIMFCKKTLNQECLECIDEFTIYNNNTKECIEIKYEYNNSLNYYTPDNGKHFYKCDYLIKNCFECTSDKICDDCITGYVLIDDERCENINTLNTTHYYIDDNNHYYTCEKQIPYCLTCQGKKICSRCKENFIILNYDYSKCIESKNYINNNEYFSKDNGISYISCYNLINNCKRCLNDNICIECFNDYFTIGNDMSKCVHISEIDYDNCEKENEKHYICYYNKIENCKKYYNIRKENCSECNNGYSIVNNDNTKCKIEDNYKNNNSFYTENDGKNYYSCSKKISNCKECLKDGSKCIKCINNYFFLNENYNICINEEAFKDNNYYRINDFEYYKCDYKGVEKCQNCLSSNHCIQCKPNYTLLDEDNSKCYLITNLTKEYYKSYEKHYKSCHKAIIGCKECLNPEYCLNCSNYYILSDNHKNCEWNTNIGNSFFIDEEGKKRKCSEALEGCDFCTSKTICTVCNKGILVEELNKKRHCIDNNYNKEYYPIDNNGNLYYNCKIGVSNCKTCESKDYCIVCEQPYGRIYNIYSYCFSDEEITKNENKYIKGEDENYYPCNYYIDNCQQCLNKNKCILCENNYSFLNNDYSNCLLTNSLNGFCSEDNGKNYYSCEANIIYCEKAKLNKCSKCRNGYTILNSNNLKCININTLMPIEHYYTDNNGINFFSCNYTIPNCKFCKMDNKKYINQINNKNILTCEVCDENYGLILDSKRHKCNYIKNSLNSYYLTKDENGNYQYKLCIKDCKICKDGINCDECNEQFLLNKGATRCIPQYQCYIQEINEESSLENIDFMAYINQQANKDNNTIYIIKGPNEDYIIAIAYGNNCDEELLKNNFYVLYFNNLYPTY